MFLILYISWTETVPYLGTAVTVIAAIVLLWYGVLQKLFAGWKDIAEQRKVENEELTKKCDSLERQAEMAIREADTRRSINDADTRTIRALESELLQYRPASLPQGVRIHLSESTERTERKG